MEHFSNGAILKSNISQMEQFSNGAFWGRHHQLDDSLVGKLTRSREALGVSPGVNGLSRGSQVVKGYVRCPRVLGDV